MPKAGGARALIARRGTKKISRSRSTPEKVEPEESPVDAAKRAHRRARYAGKKSGRKQRSPTAMVGDGGDEGWNDLADPKVQQVIFSCLRNDLWRENACTIARVSDRTVQSWCSKGRLRSQEIDEWTERSLIARDAGDSEVEILSELGPRPSYNRYAEFNDQVVQAEGISEKSLIGTIHTKARSGDVSSCQWLLARKRPRRYGTAVVTGQFLEDQSGEGSKEDPISELADILTGMAKRLVVDFESE